MHLYFILSYIIYINIVWINKNIILQVHSYDDRYLNTYYHIIYPLT